MSAFDGTDHPSDRMSEYQRVASEGGLSLKRKTRRLEALSAVLAPAEAVLALSAGTAEGNLRENLLTVTDHRILILKDDPGEAVSLDLGRVVKITAKRGFGSGQIDILLQDMRVKITVAHNDSVVLFARRAEEARRNRQEADLSATVHPHYAPDPDDARSVPRSSGHASAAPYRDRETAEIGTPDLIETRPITAPMQQPLSSDAQPARMPALREIVEQDEQILLFTTGTSAEGTTLVAVTDRRVVVMEQRSTGEVQTSAFELNGIDSIAGEAGPEFGQIKIEYGGNLRTIGMIKADMVQPLVNLTQELIRERKPPPPKPLPAPEAASSTGSPVDVADQLEKLASLMERGILTPEEFAQQKAKLLDS